MEQKISLYGPTGDLLLTSMANSYNTDQINSYYPLYRRPGKRPWVTPTSVAMASRAERSKQTLTNNPYIPLKISLRLFGLRIDYNPRDPSPCPWTCCGKVRRYLWTLLIVLYLHYFAIQGSLSLIRGALIWNNMKVLVMAWITVFTVEVFLLRQHRLGRLLYKIENMNYWAISPPGIMKRAVLGWTIGAWIYLLIFAFLQFFELNDEVVQQAFDNHYGINGSEVSTSTAKTVLQVDSICGIFLVQGPLIFIIVTYVLMCRAMQCAFADIGCHANNYQKAGRHFSTYNLREIRQRYQTIVSYVSDLDDIYSLPVFLWYVMITLTSCARVSTIVTNELSDGQHLEGWISNAWSLGRSILIFFGVSLAGSRVSEEAQEAIFRVELVAAPSVLDQNVDPGVYHELNFLMSKVSASPVSLTGWKFFSVRRGFMLSLMGVIVTYAVITIQINPKAMETLKNLS